MKSVIAYIAICVAAFSAIIPGQAMAELHKIPALINHYKHHQNGGGHEQMSFTAFLAMHYDRNSAHKEEEDHGDLPLFHSCCVNVLFVAETTTIVLWIKETEPALLPVEVKNQYSYSLHHTIFQPPRA
ncbi:MAG: hypothetical protein V4590_02780 [Bacteroidota bacterium]